MSSLDIEKVLVLQVCVSLVFNCKTNMILILSIDAMLYWVLGISQAPFVMLLLHRVQCKNCTNIKQQRECFFSWYIEP